MIDEHVDTLDLGTMQPEFQPPKQNNFLNQVTFDQNQTIKLGADETMASNRLAAPIKGGNHGVNDTGNDTMQRIVAHLNKEENDRSETGGDDYMNEDWL